MPDQHPASTSDADKRNREAAGLAARDAPAWKSPALVSAERAHRLASQRATITRLQAENTRLQAENTRIAEKYVDAVHTIRRALAAHHVSDRHGDCVSCTDESSNPEPAPCPTALALQGVAG